MPSEQVFLALGSNVGDRLQNLLSALRQLKQKTSITQLSSIYTSQPMYVLDQPEFYNMVVAVETALEPEELLAFCKNIEQSVGRVKRFRNGPREIDIDILLYGERVVRLPELVIPHPRMAERSFVLVPLVEIAPEHGKLLEDLGDFESLVQTLSASELRSFL